MATTVRRDGRMRRRRVIQALLWSALAPRSGAARAAETSPQLPLSVVADVPLPGPANRFDYQSYDAPTHRLFIAHLGAGTLVVFDTRGQQVVAEIPNLKGVHGVLAVSEQERVYASATGTNEVAAIDARTLQEVGRMPGGIYPDGLAYAPGAHKLYVSDENGRTETVIDIRTGKRIATIPLEGEAGNTQYDPGSGHVFVNVQTTGDLVEIDPRTDAIIGRHPLPGAKGNHGLLIEAGEHVAYIACEGNARLLVFDLDAKKVISGDTLGSGPDVLAFDPVLRLLYVASESGVVSLFRQDGKQLVKLGQGLLAHRAHTVAVDPETHRAYFPIENLDGRPVLRIMQPMVR